MEYTTIRVTKQQRDAIASVSKSYRKSTGDFAVQCVEFCRKNKYDPYAIDEIQITEEFKKLKNQLISFIRKQEADFIQPMAKSVNDLKRQSIESKELLVQVMANTAEIDGNESGNSIESKSESSQLAKLEQILEIKNKQLSDCVQALNKIKDNIINDKGSSANVSLKPEQLKSLIESVL